MSEVIDKICVGDCFVEDEHFFLQRDTDVLHVNTKTMMINSIPTIGIIDQFPKFSRIEKGDFDIAVKKTIYEMDLYSYWGKN